MSAFSIAWIALPFFIGFSIYLFPKFDRALALSITVLSFGYGLARLLTPDALTLHLLDNFGVTLIADQLSGYFILTNAIVTAAVIVYCWQQQKSAFFYTQMTILHGSVNAIFIGADLISFYVALEVISIAAFLLIAYPRSDRAIWIGLRYLFVSNTAMLFYLVGAILVYQATHSFALVGLAQAPPEAIALISLGLLTKGGIFVSGLWLPLTHAEAATPVSALLSGIVVKAGIFPLIRAALLVDNLTPFLAIFGMGTAVLGVLGAIASQDTKRLLAFSTISQLGFVLVAPVAAGFYALTHGLAKATLFLSAGSLPSRQFEELREQGISRPLWIALVIAALSISGCPLLSGFAAKSLTLKAVEPWQAIVLNIAAVGTAIALAKFIFLPLAEDAKGKPVSSSFGAALVLLLSGLFTANVFAPTTYVLPNLTKALGIIAIAWLVYFVLIQRVRWSVPRYFERLDHLIGMMSVMLTLLFWMVLA